MYPQRLPIVDDDDGVWGDILRKYLLKEHYDTGADSAENGGHKNVTIRAGTAGAGGAPLKFTSGTLLTSPEVGAMEFVGDNLYLTQTSSTTRKKVAIYDDASGATGDIYYRNATGYFTRLAAGTASQILTLTGSPALPTWQTLSAYVTGGTDVSVVDGGTGRSTSTTAYGVIAAGTTATGVHQTISPGTSGQFLKSAGASALGAFANITAADITGTTAQFNTALSDNDFATIAGSETLSSKTLTAPRFVSGGLIADNNGNEQIVFTTTASAVNEIGITNAATGVAPQISARGGDTNVSLNLVPKGTGRIQANGVNIPTTTSLDTLTNKTIDGSTNTISNIPWSGISGKPAVIAAGATIDAALSAVNLTQIVGGSNGAKGREFGAYARNAIYSHPESEHFAPIPHLYNDIAYNNDRGGSVAVLLNGSIVAANGNNATEVFTPDATYSFVNFYSSTSDVVAIEITLHRTFYWNYNFGIQQTDWCRGQNVKFEAYNGSTWTTLADKTNEPTGLLWGGGDGGATGITKLRISLTNFSVPAATGIRVTQIFLVGFDSTLLSGTFLPRGGGVLYGELGTPAVWTDLIKDRATGTGIAQFFSNPSAVNYLQFQNRATGAGPGIYAQGADTNIDINLIPKGTGNVLINGSGLLSASSTTTLTNKTIDAASNTIIGMPYDLSIIAFGTYTARVANSYGDFPMGIKLQRAVTFTQVVYRVNVADASGNLVVQLRKNGTTVTGTSATIAAANQVAGGTVTGTWAFAAGDIITVYVTGVGTTPGAGLIADIRGATT